MNYSSFVVFITTKIYIQDGFKKTFLIHEPLTRTVCLILRSVVLDISKLCLILLTDVLDIHITYIQVNKKENEILKYLYTRLFMDFSCLYFHKTPFVTNRHIVDTTEHI